MPEVVWINPAPERCDLCATPINCVFIDGKTRQRVWAILCEACHATHGVGLGTGQGQKYLLRDGEDRFVKVE